MINDQDGVRAKHREPRVYLCHYCFGAEPAAAHSTHSVQAEASGGTVEHEISMYGPAKLQGLCATLDPVQEQPQDVNRSVHVPVPQ